MGWGRVGWGVGSGGVRWGRVGPGGVMGPRAGNSSRRSAGLQWLGGPLH